MGKTSGDIMGGITKPKKAKSSAPASKHAATATDSKSKPNDAENKKATKKGASVPLPQDEPSKKSKSSLEIDGLFGQLKGATATATAKSKVRKTPFTAL